MNVGADPDANHLPAALLELWRELFGDTLPGVLEALRGSRRPSLRVHAGRATVDAVVDRLDAEGLHPERVAWYEHALHFPDARDSAEAVRECAVVRDGLAYQQGLSSMVVPLVLAPRPGERVLDMAAAPGSKTTQILEQMDGSGEIVANDRSRKRLYKLRAVLERHGSADVVQVTSRPGQVFGRLEPEGFDRVLVDAPCSMEGRIRLDDPRTFDDWRPAKVKRLAGQQRAMLASAIRAVRPGGVVVYATCTLSPEENERVVARTLRRFGDRVRIDPIDLDLPGRSAGLAAWRGKDLPGLDRAVRILPSRAMEGFFVARLRKVDSTLD